MNYPIIAALFISLAAVLVVRRGVDVRFVLIAAGLFMAGIAGTPWTMFDAFQAAVGRGDIIGPICTAMGYAYLLKATGCDRDMVKLLTDPLRRFRWLLIPGGCAIGFLTNMAITSQTASAAALGPILVPVMIAAGYSPLTAAATLLVGCSVGGNLFNPGEPDIVAIQSAVGIGASDIMAGMLIPNLIAFTVATVTLMVLSRRELVGELVGEHAGEHSGKHVISPASSPTSSLLKAAMPPLPVALLLLLQPSLGLVPSLFEIYPDGLHVSMVMLCCGALVMLIGLRGERDAPRRISELTEQFFEGMGFAFSKVISIILSAACFIAGLNALGVITALSGILGTNAALAVIVSPLVTWGVAFIGGSGTAASVSFSKSMLPPLAGSNPALALKLGVSGSIGANIGRTMSPVAAIVLFVSALADVQIQDLMKRVLLPMLAALASVIVLGLLH
jgi:C4-dicarboxylate transporter, DcuC family